MQFIQLVYVSAYVNQYGLDLPKLVEKTALDNDDGGVLGMTLFSNGNIMQLLEGRPRDVDSIFQKLQSHAHQWNVFEMFRGPIENLSQSETSIGFDTHSYKLISKTDSEIALFKLNAIEVDQRLKESPAKAFMLQFAADHW